MHFCVRELLALEVLCVVPELEELGDCDEPEPEELVDCEEPELELPELEELGDCVVPELEELVDCEEPELELPEVDCDKPEPEEAPDAVPATSTVVILAPCVPPEHTGLTTASDAAALALAGERPSQAVQNMPSRDTSRRCAAQSMHCSGPLGPALRDVAGHTQSVPSALGTFPWPHLVHASIGTLKMAGPPMRASHSAGEIGTPLARLLTSGLRLATCGSCDPERPAPSPPSELPEDWAW